MSDLDIPKDSDKETLREKLKDVLQPSKQATIVDLQEPIDLFEDDSTEQLRAD